MIDDALALIDHVAFRVTASAIAGVGSGAAYATLKGFPLFKTSVSTAFSFALISTACFGMERMANIAIRQSTTLINGQSKIDPNGSSIIQPTINPRLHYGSHALGGILGGGMAGFLFQGKSLAGIFLLTPIMLGVGKIEISLDEYRTERLKQLISESEDGDQEEESIS